MTAATASRMHRVLEYIDMAGNRTPEISKNRELRRRNEAPGRGIVVYPRCGELNQPDEVGCDSHGR